MKENELPLIKGITCGGDLRRDTANAISQYQRKGTAQRGECTLGTFFAEAAAACGGGGAGVGSGGTGNTGLDILSLLDMSAVSGGTATLVGGILTVTHAPMGSVTIPLTMSFSLGAGSTLFAKSGDAGNTAGTVRLGPSTGGISVSITGPGASGAATKTSGSHVGASLTVSANGGGTTMSVELARLWGAEP